MSNSLSWNLHGDDNLSMTLERLERTLSGLSRKLDSTGRQAVQMGEQVGRAEGAVGRLHSTSGRLGSAMDAAKSKVSALTGALATMAVGAGTALAVGGGLAAKFGLDVAMSNETAMVSFEMMLGSAKKAKDFLKQLGDFADATPFELSQLKEAAAGLLTVGVRAKDVIPLLTKIGDSAAAMNKGPEAIQRAVIALQQMSMTGHVTLEDMNQLRDAGVPAIEALAAELGKTIPETQKLISKGAVGSQKMFDALEKGAGASMHRVAGMMDKQSATLAGKWSTFKDKMQRIAGELFEPALPSLGRLVDGVTAAIPKAIAGIGSMGGQIKSIFKGSDVPDKLMKALDKLKDRILPELKKGWDGIVKTISDHKEGLEKLGRFIADVLIPVVGDILVGAIDAFAWAIEASITVASKFVDALHWMTKTSMTFIGTMLHMEADAFGWIPDIGPKLIKAADDFDKFEAKVEAAFSKLDGKKADVWIETHDYGAKGEHGGSGVQDYGTKGEHGGSGAVAVVTVGAGKGSKTTGGFQAHATGGDYQANTLLRVGEHGPEYLYATAPGRVMTQAQAGGGGTGGDLGTVRVILEWPDGTVIREQLLKLKRNRGFGTLGLA